VAGEPVFRELGGLLPAFPVPSRKFIQIIAIRAVAGEGGLIEQALDAATKADLIGASLHSDGPAHFAVPAAARDQDGESSQAGSRHADGHKPTRLTFLFEGFYKGWGFGGFHELSIRRRGMEHKSAFGHDAIASVLEASTDLAPHVLRGIAGGGAKL